MMHRSKINYSPDQKIVVNKLAFKLVGPQQQTISSQHQKDPSVIFPSPLGQHSHKLGGFASMLTSHSKPRDKSSRLYESNDYNIREILSKCEEFPIKKLNNLLSGPSPLPIFKKGVKPQQLLDPIVPKNFKLEITQVWETVNRKVNHEKEPEAKKPKLVETVRQEAEGINFASDDQSIYMNDTS
jgi:hypothetical protein